MDEFVDVSAIVFAFDYVVYVFGLIVLFVFQFGVLDYLAFLYNVFILL